MEPQDPDEDDDAGGNAARPVTRECCSYCPRPCPFVGCRYNLYLDVNGKGGIRFNFPHIEPWEMPWDRSCALDVAETGAQTLDAVGLLLNLTRERARQIEAACIAKLRKRSPAASIEDFVLLIPIADCSAFFPDDD
jgi:hypothetical protein